MEQNPISGQSPACTGRKTDRWGLCEYPLAMVYTPVQAFRGLYDIRTALCRGTLFSELDLPFEGSGYGRHGRQESGSGCGGVCGCRRNGREA